MEIVKRSDDRKAARRGVERTFSWFGRNRRLAKDFENPCRNLFAFEADPHAKFEAAARDDINGRNVLGKTYRIVKGHQQHAGCDADPVGTGGDRRGGRQD